MRQRVQPVKAGDCILHLEIVQTACRQNEPSVSKPPRQFDACRVDTAESQPKSQASGSQAFAWTGLALRHDTTLSGCNVPAEAKTLGQGYESHRQHGRSSVRDGQSVGVRVRSVATRIQTTRLNHRVATLDTPIPPSSRWRFQTAVILAIAADAVQICAAIFSLKARCRSPRMCLTLQSQRSWCVCLDGIGNPCQHSWANSCPVSIWFRLDFAVVNVYRKWKQTAITEEETRHEHGVVEGEYKSS